MKKTLGILFLSSFLLGCNTNIIKQDVVKQFIKAPKVENIQLKSFSAKEQSAVFSVSLYNPNFFPLPVTGLSGNFKLNQIAVGSMTATSNESLGAQKTQEITLPIQLNSDAIVNAAKQAFSTRKANYSFSGDVETTAGKLPITQEGSVSVSDIISTLLP